VYRAGFAVKSAYSRSRGDVRSGASHTACAVGSSRALTANVRHSVTRRPKQVASNPIRTQIMMTLFVHKDGEFVVAEGKRYLGVRS
jgi:hypothetical protein